MQSSLFRRELWPLSLSTPPAMGDVDDMIVATDSDDDLEITQSMRKYLGHGNDIKSAPLSPHPYPKPAE